MGVPGKTSGHSIQIVLGGSKKNRGLNPNSPINNLNPGQKALAKDGPDGLKAVAAMENKSVEEVKSMVNRAGSPVRQMNNNMINQTDMGQMPFQNNAIVNAQGMKQMDMSVNPNIPGALPGSGNVPGNQMIPNPVARTEDEPKKEVVYQGDAGQMVKDYGALPTSSRKDLGVKDFKTSGSTLPEIEIVAKNN